MEILNGFPAPSDEELVVITVLTPTSSLGLANHTNLVWVSQPQLLLAEKGCFPLKELIEDSSGTVVLRNLLVTPEKHEANLKFLESCGAKVIYVASEPEDLSEFWPGMPSESIWPERTVKMEFRPSHQTSGNRAMALVVGFDESEFPQAIRGLPQVRFVWKARQYGFDGFLPRVREAFINPRLGMPKIHEIKRTLIQGGLGDVAVSYRSHSTAVEAVLLKEYSGPGLPNANRAQEKTLTVIISQSRPRESLKRENVVWWNPDKDSWDNIPRLAARFVVSLEILRYDRLMLEQEAAGRGIKFFTYATDEELVKLLNNTGTTASGKPCQVPPPIIQPAAQETKPAEPKSSETEISKGERGVNKVLQVTSSVVSMSDIIRANLHLAYDELVELVQKSFPNAKRTSILSMRCQLAKKQKFGGVAKPGPKQAAPALEPEKPPAASASQTDSAAAASEPKSGQKEESDGKDVLARLDKAAQLIAEAGKLIAGARKEVEEMRAYKKLMEPVQLVLDKMASQAKQ